MSILRYINSANYHPAWNAKADDDFFKKIDFKDIKFSVKIRDIRKVEKENFIDISVFGYKNKDKYPIYISKTLYDEKRVDPFLIGEEGKDCQRS